MKIAAGFIFFLFTTSLLHGDVLFFKNQKYIKGKVTDQSTDSVQFKKESGETINVPKGSIKKIIFIPQDDQDEQNKIAEMQEKLRLQQIEEERQRRQQMEAERQIAEANQKKKNAEEVLLKDHSKKYSESLYLGATLRNAVLPGWGQYYKGEKKKGKILMGLAAMGLLYTFPAINAYNKAKSNYDNMSMTSLALPRNSASLGPAAWTYTEATSARAEMAKNSDMVYRGTLFLAGIYLYALSDAWFRKTSSTVGYYVIPERSFSSNGIGTQAGIRFYYHF